MDDQTRTIALDLAIRVQAGRPIEEVIADAEKILAWLRPGGDIRALAKK